MTCQPPTPPPPSSQPSSAGDVLSEQGRLNTFRYWPHSAAVAPGVLAKAGFYYLGQTDRVRCAFCGGTLKNWQNGDDPFAEHRKHFGQCLFIQGQDVGNVPLPPPPPSASSASRSGPSALTEQGGCLQKGGDAGPELSGMGWRLNPRHPDLQSLDSRLASFSQWPPEAVLHPSTLVDAGFFYTGHGDGVRCFCCDGTLHNWEPGDDPWVEHARWFPRCPYLLQQKGQGFVADIQGRQVALQEAQQSRLSPHHSPAFVQREMQQEDPVMSSAVVREALSMGFDPQLVRSTLQQLTFTSGGQPPALDQLVNALLGETPGDRQHRSGEATQPQVTMVSNPGLHPHTLPGRASPHTSQGEEAGGDRTLCKICMDREVAVTFLPCGHLVCCAECAKSVRQCPVCRQTVRASIRTYLC